MNKASFTPGDDGKTLIMERKFDASRDRVWDAWTKPEILDQWWAPAPWKAVTKTMEFKEGGQWFYYMQGPDGERHYCIVNYTKINPQENFSATDAFADENRNVDTKLPQNHWFNQFMEDGETTQVKVTITCDSVEDLQTLIKMGMQEGFSQGLDQLEALLQK